MDTVWNIFVILLLCGGTYLLSKHFFSWETPFLSFCFIGYYLTLIVEVGLSVIIMRENYNPCVTDCRGETLGMAATYMVQLSVSAFIFIIRIFLYCSIPSVKLLTQQLPEHVASKWITFRQIILILMFIVPVICFEISTTKAEVPDYP